MDIAKLKELAESLGTETLIAILLLALGASLIIEGAPAVLAERWRWTEMGAYGLGCLMVVVSIPFWVLSYFKLKKSILASRGLQLIAWNGFNEPEVVRPYQKIQKKLEVLEYTRGIEKVTHLKYEGSWFDVLISDVEFLHRHDTGQKLRLLSDKTYGGLWNAIQPSVARRVKQLQGQRLIGVPVRFGLNDLIFNRPRTQRVLELPGNVPSLESRPYEYFALGRVAEASAQAGIKIGLWNWYLPTLLVLLLTEGVEFQDLWSQKEQKIRQITELIQQHADHFLLYDDPQRATKALVGGDVWTVFGGGSWLMPLEPSNRKDLVAVCPDKGAIMWVECAAVIEGEDVTHSLRYIQYLLEKDVQVKLAMRKAYRSCPVTTEVLDNVPPQIFMPFNLAKVFGDTGQAAASWTLRDNIFLRQLPQAWRSWEGCWEDVENTVKHD